MLINWYPGHMNKARRKVKEMMPRVDVVIEVLDARLPQSSTNPMIERLRGDKPYVKVMTKSDLADPEVTEAWLSFFREQWQTDAIAVTTEKPKMTLRVPERVMAMLPAKRPPGRPPTAMILGIPNVGKSTLINTLAGRKVASVGNEPAVTKAQQKIPLANGLHLIDTPGMTWPGSKDELVNYRLATTGAIRDTAMAYDDVAMFALEFMLQRYPERITKWYSLQQLPEYAHETLELIAQKRGCARGRSVDWQRAGEIFVRDLRAGKMGAISLEEPHPI